MMRRKLNPKLMKKAMKKMGINVEELPDVSEVIIKCSGREIVISNPQVTRITGAGQESFQVTGEVSERALSESASKTVVEEKSMNLEIPVEDVKLVCSQTGVSEEEAVEALRLAGGNIAQAIINLRNR
jgi:nascent polypeptide-associated complex subunit alpha